MILRSTTRIKFTEQRRTEAVETRRKAEIAGFYFRQVIILSRRVARDKQATCKSRLRMQGTHRERRAKQDVGQERIVEEELSTTSSFLPKRWKIKLS